MSAGRAPHHLTRTHSLVPCSPNYKNLRVKWVHTHKDFTVEPAFNLVGGSGQIQSCYLTVYFYHPL